MTGARPIRYADSPLRNARATSTSGTTDRAPAADHDLLLRAPFPAVDR